MFFLIVVVTPALATVRLPERTAALAAVLTMPIDVRNEIIAGPIFAMSVTISCGTPAGRFGAMAPTKSTPIWTSIAGVSMPVAGIKAEAAAAALLTELRYPLIIATIGAARPTTPERAEKADRKSV